MVLTIKPLPNKLKMIPTATNSTLYWARKDADVLKATLADASTSVKWWRQQEIIETVEVTEPTVEQCIVL